jgi:DNA invertase Pin-like site-specific DNA recombinase
MAPNPKAYSYIRLSTGAQRKGDGQRRQLELSARYAAENGLELMHDLELQDLGVSAFTGENVSSGALGRFLAAVQSGLIAKGSYLLVESLDRITRQKPTSAIGKFLEIINSGIVLVTIGDRREYTAETVKLEDLIYSLVVLSRAHEESATKSKRISAAWANKRGRATQYKLTAKCPAWLSLSSDRASFTIDTERAALIGDIFADAFNGLGSYTITERLNKRAVPAFLSSRGWHTSTINKILTSRAVTGEFQPHRMSDGQRIPDGPPIPNYFPRIVEQDVFDAVQAGRALRRVRGGGRRGATISNLFSKIARCYYCGSTMRYVDKGAGPKGGRYLVCGKGLRKAGCVSARWKYSDFEKSFLTFVDEVDLDAIFDPGKYQFHADRAASNKANAAHQIVSLELERDRIYSLISRPDVGADFLASKLRECEAKISAARDDLAKASQQSATIDRALRASVSSDETRQLAYRVSQTHSEESYRIRSRVSERLRSLISSLTIAPGGLEPLRAASDSRVKQYASDGDRWPETKFFEVCFKQGGVRFVYVSDSDPAVLEFQIVQSDAEQVQHFSGNPYSQRIIKAVSPLLIGSNH